MASRVAALGLRQMASRVAALGLRQVASRVAPLAIHQSSREATAIGAAREHEDCGDALLCHRGTLAGPVDGHAELVVTRMLASAATASRRSASVAVGSPVPPPITERLGQTTGLLDDVNVELISSSRSSPRSPSALLESAGARSQGVVAA
jgi:hypothetical protein